MQHRVIRQSYWRTYQIVNKIIIDTLDVPYILKPCKTGLLATGKGQLAAVSPVITTIIIKWAMYGLLCTLELFSSLIFKKPGHETWCKGEVWGTVTSVGGVFHSCEAFTEMVIGWGSRTWQGLHRQQILLICCLIFFIILRVCLYREKIQCCTFFLSLDGHIVC